LNVMMGAQKANVLGVAQLQVQNAVLSIPPGLVTAYGELRIVDVARETNAISSDRADGGPVLSPQLAKEG
jgi:hypothetical protein